MHVQAENPAPSERCKAPGSDTGFWLETLYVALFNICQCLRPQQQNDHAVPLCVLRSVVEFYFMLVKTE